MATNTLTAVIPKLLAMGLEALRENAIMPLLVNRSYDAIAGEKGSTIDVPIPSAIAVQDVSPNYIPPDTAAVVPTSVPIALDQWKEAPFFLSDKDQLEIMNGFMPMQATEAVKAVANTIDQYILSQYKGFYGFYGNESSGAFLTPFTDASGDPTNTKDALRVRTILNKQLAPMNDRRGVLDPDAEGAALNLRAFQDAAWNGDTAAIIAGKLNQKLGFAWFMDQNIPKHTAGTAAAATNITNVTARAAGVASVTLVKASVTATLLKGDILTFSGHSQTYVVTDTGPLTIPTSGTQAVSIQPALQAAVADTEAVDVKPSHSVNLMFHRDAIAFATRPLVSLGNQFGGFSQAVVDPISGLTLRLEVTREFKRIRFSYDVLYGAAVVRRELGARLAGAI